jgi:pyruvate dehydrogenase E2 component (dihydrolipoamide acetyltransferase)
MATEFTMPKLGLTMEAGTIREWLVASGNEVRAGQAVLLIETDKVETEVEASGAGVLHHVGAVGESYPCGELIGWFLEPGESPPARVVAPAPSPSAARPAAGVAADLRSMTAPARPDGRLFASPNARRVAAELGIDIATVDGTGPGGRIVSEDVEAASRRPAAMAPARAAAPRGRPLSGSSGPATVAARQLADLLGVDLAEVEADPRDGRVSREDVARYVRGLLAERAVGARGSRLPDFPLGQTPTMVVPMTGMRATIATRMHGSLTEMAQLTLFMDVDMNRVVAHRAALGGQAVVPGYTDYVIAAVARALREVPVVNSQVTDAGVALLPDVHVGLAVALDGGLIVPVVRHTDRLDMVTLAAETTRLATAARSGKLKLDDLEGGTFSVTALGMFGVDGFTPVINPPNTAILGVGRLRDDVGWDEAGRPVKVKRLTLSLTWDHRAFDGVPAAEFTRAVVAELEAF